MNILNLCKIFFIIIIILVIIFYIIFYVSYFRKKKNITESFTDSGNNNIELIKYGNFENKQHILNSEVSQGNLIVTYPNPGNSSYVLQQSTLIANCENTEISYKIRLYLSNKKFYRLTAWVCVSPDWNGSNYIFSLRIINTNNRVFTKSEGRIINTQKIYNLNWTLYEYILQLNANDTGEVHWFLGYQPDNTQGNRFITGVSCMIFNPLLKDFRVCLGLQCFLSTNNDFSYNTSNLIWKDLSNNGRDFRWSNLSVLDNEGSVNIKNIKITGPITCNLGIRPDLNFTIMWYCRYNKPENCPENSFFELFTLYSNCYSFPFLKVEVNLSNGKIYITAGRIKYSGISIGFCQTKSLYTLTKNGNRIFLRKDDLLLDCPDIIVYDDEISVNMLSDHKKFILNPSGLLDANLSAFLIYNRALNVYEIEIIRAYLMSNKCYLKAYQDRFECGTGDQCSQPCGPNKKSCDENKQIDNGQRQQQIFTFSDNDKNDNIPKNNQDSQNNQFDYDDDDDDDDYIYTYESESHENKYYTDQEILINKQSLNNNDMSNQNNNNLSINNTQDKNIKGYNYEQVEGDVIENFVSSRNSNNIPGLNTSLSDFKNISKMNFINGNVNQGVIDQFMNISNLNNIPLNNNTNKIDKINYTCTPDNIKDYKNILDKKSQKLFNDNLNKFNKKISDLNQKMNLGVNNTDKQNYIKNYQNLKLQAQREINKKQTKSQDIIENFVDLLPPAGIEIANQIASSPSKLPFLKNNNPNPNVGIQFSNLVGQEENSSYPHSPEEEREEKEERFPIEEKEEKNEVEEQKIEREEQKIEREEQKIEREEEIEERSEISEKHEEEKYIPRWKKDKERCEPHKFMNHGMIEKEKFLVSQMLSRIENSSQYLDSTIRSDFREVLSNAVEEFNKSCDKEEKENLILKIRLLNELIIKDEKVLKDNPLAKKKNMINTQGEEIKNVNYVKNEDDCEIFNRSIFNKKKNNCDIDLSKYLKKTYVNDNYISKVQLANDYVKKDEIPCWGCNLKDEPDCPAPSRISKR